MNPAGTVIRAPYPDESARLKSILARERFPASAEFLLLVREQPVERIAAVLAWWKEAEEEGAEDDLVFLIASPGPAREKVWAPLLEKLPELAKDSNVTRCRHANPLVPADAAFGWLADNGFTPEPLDRTFLIPVEVGFARTRRILSKIGGRIPANWRVKRLAGEDPQKLFDLVRPHRLIKGSRFRRCWSIDGGEHFHPDLSAVLYEGEKLLACILATRRDDALVIEAECCHLERPDARMMANAVLMDHIIRHSTAAFPLAFHFQANRHLHRQTANMALRMGGTELEPRYRMTRLFPDAPPACEGCGRDSAAVVDGKGWCVDCFQAAGSCCAGEE